MGKKTFKRKINPNPEQAELYDKITFIETKIIQKITKLKKTKPNFNLCDHLLSDKIENQRENNKTELTRKYDPKQNYYDKYWKEYLMALTLLKKMSQFQEQVEKVEQSIQEIEKKFIERETLLNLPALSKVKKNIVKNTHHKTENRQNQEPEPVLAHNPIVELKKEEELEPQFTNYHQNFDNHIFYE